MILETRGKIGGTMQCLAIIILTMVTGGATCIPRRSIPEFQPKPIFTTAPTMDQLTEVVNRTRNVQSLQSNSVSVTLNNERAVNTNMTWGREKRFRMSASIAGVAGFDLGSNDDFFWMTVKNFATTPEMYFAKHSEFDSMPTSERRMLPVSPVWLVEAMGVSDLNPSQLISQPVTRADGLVELTSIVPSPIGNYTRTLIVDPKFGYSHQVFLRDPSGRLVANAQQSKHQFYPSIQSSLPHQIKVQLIPERDPMWELDISIGAYLVNGLPPDNMTQFTMPNMASYKVTNLAQQITSLPQVAPPQPTTPQLSYRGVTWDGSQRR